MKYAAMKHSESEKMKDYGAFIDASIEDRLFFGKLLKSINTARKMLPELSISNTNSICNYYGSTNREQFLNCSKEYCLQRTVNEEIIFPEVRASFNRCKTLLSMAVNEYNDEKFLLCMMIVYERSKDL